MTESLHFDADQNIFCNACALCHYSARDGLKIHVWFAIERFECDLP